MTDRQYRRRSDTAQPAWKKSAASIVAAWACMNCRQVVSVRRCGAGDLQGFEDPADGGCADPVAELEQLAWILLYPQPLFSVASSSMGAAISALTGGRPVRRG